MNDLKMPLSNINPPTPFNRMSPLSFHKSETINHPNIPTVLRYRSQTASCGSPVALIAIANMTIMLENHLIYHAIFSFCLALRSFAVSFVSIISQATTFSPKM